MCQQQLVLFNNGRRPPHPARHALVSYHKQAKCNDLINPIQSVRDGCSVKKASGTEWIQTYACRSPVSVTLVIRVNNFCMFRHLDFEPLFVFIGRLFVLSTVNTCEWLDKF